METRSSQSIKAVIILGPTASGKTRLGVEVGKKFNGEIVSADSRQIYRGMDIGTGKDLAEYGTGRQGVAYHLIDLVEPDDEFNLFLYLRHFNSTLLALRQRDKLPVAVGGSPLYIKAVLENYQMPGRPSNPEARQQWEHLSSQQLRQKLQEQSPDLYARTDKTQRRRLVRALEIASASSEGEEGRGGGGAAEVKLAPLLIAPYYPRREMHRRIEQRLDERLYHGLLEEVKQLHERGVNWERLEFFGLEYRAAARYLKGEVEYEEFREQLLAGIRRFCKAQDGWFRKFERDGWDIHWIPRGEPRKAFDLVELFIHDKPLPEPELRLNEILYGPRS